jgi:hypothetical protein
MSGPSEKRIDLLFIGDGFSKAESFYYFEYVQKMLNAFSEDELLSEYSDFFNITVLGYESPYKQYPLKSHIEDLYSPAPLINKVLVYETLIEQYGLAPHEFDQVIIVSNGWHHGATKTASALTGLVAISTLSPGETLIHELGHSIGKLVDEYVLSSFLSPKCSQESQSPNHFSTMDLPSLTAADIPWSHWFLDGTLPEIITNATSNSSNCNNNVDSVGIYQGAFNCGQNYYRPTCTSKMRDKFQPWGPVNTEQMAIQMNSYILSIEDYSPKDELSYPYTDGLKFKVTTKDLPSDHYATTWILNGAAHSTGMALTLSEDDLKPGLNEMIFEIKDPNPNIRFDPLNKSIKRVHWHLDKPKTTSDLAMTIIENAPNFEALQDTDFVYERTDQLSYPKGTIVPDSASAASNPSGPSYTHTISEPLFYNSWTYAVESNKVLLKSRYFFKVSSTSTPNFHYFNTVSSPVALDLPLDLNKSWTYAGDIEVQVLFGQTPIKYPYTRESSVVDYQEINVNGQPHSCAVLKVKESINNQMTTHYEWWSEELGLVKITQLPSEHKTSLRLNQTKDKP